MVTTDSADHVSSIFGISNRRTVSDVKVRKVMRKLDLRSFSSSSNSPLRKLCQLLSHVLHVEELATVFIPEKIDKKFCEGLLEPGVHHPWKRVLRRQSLLTRLSVAHSLFLFRKVIPSDVVDPVLNATRFAERMSQKETRRLAPGFLQFVRNRTRDMFKKGWDQDRYDDKLRNFTLPTNACIERSKGNGGPRGLCLSGESGMSRADFFGDHLYDGIRSSRLAKVQTIWTNGKMRTVTVSSWKRTHLKPLHNAIYDKISKEKWLLRGEAKPSSFLGFEKKEGEIFVSGDYESATDHVDARVSEEILRAILDNAVCVPDSIKTMAMDTLRSVLYVDRGPEGVFYFESRKQLMGNFLCFPLLCLVNYFTFKFSVPREVPVKINGDDIVFRSTPQEKENWFKGVCNSGLVLSKGKTSVSCSTFSLNSSIFRAGRSVRLVPFVRSKPMFTDPECPAAIGGAVHSVGPGFSGGAKKLLQSACIQNKAKHIYCSNRSLYDLGVRVAWSVVVDVGMQAREDFYCSLDDASSHGPPIPVPKDVWIQNAIPDGWVRKFSSSKQDPRFIEEMIACSWRRAPRSKTPQSTEQYWREIRATGDSFKNYQFSQRKRRSLYCAMTGQSMKSAKYALWKNIRKPIFWDRKKRMTTQSVWVKEVVGDEEKNECLHFVSNLGHSIMPTGSFDPGNMMETVVFK